MEYQHGGNIYGDMPVRWDFSVNTHPDGMPESVREAVLSSAERWEQYPDEQSRALRTALSDFYKENGYAAEPSFLIPGNGASDVLYSFLFALRPAKALITVPCFSEYEKALLACGSQVMKIRLRPEENFFPERRKQEILSALRGENRPDLLILGNPNNPTGHGADAAFLREISDCCLENGVRLLIDECFVWFLKDAASHSLLPDLTADPERYRGVFLLNAFTKIFSMAGLRLGYGICTDEQMRERILRVRQSWSISAPAEAAGIAALGERERIRNAAAETEKERIFLETQLGNLGFTVYPSDVNYLLFHAPEFPDLQEMLLLKGILIRSCRNYEGLGEGWFRTAVRNRTENQILVSCLREAVKEKERRQWQK